MTMGPHIGDQTLGEKSTSVLQGGADYRGRLTSILANPSSTMDTGVSVLHSGGIGVVDTAKRHWPLIILVLIVVYVLWHYNRK